MSTIDADRPLPQGWAQPAHRPTDDPLTETTLPARMRENLARPFQRTALAHATDSSVAKTHLTFAGVDHDALRERGRRIRAHAIAQLPRYLDEWLANADRNGIQVHFAADDAEARRLVAEICVASGAARVVKSKSMASEEISLNSALEDAGLDVYETDLGEFVVQAMGDRPSHVIGPIIHRTQGEVHELFSTMAGEQLPDTPESLTAFARERLRAAFVTADVGISGGNFLIADTGEVAMVTNEGNGRMTTSLPGVHIALVGIEKLLPRREDLAVLLPLLTGHGTGQLITTYVSLLGGARRAPEPDGPEEMHVVLLDSGRSDLLGGPFEEALHCVRCGACQNICPVYRQVGGHAYGWVYGGPIGAVLTPLFRGPRAGGELAQASTLCGACDDICPVRIPLHDLLLGLRERNVEVGAISARERLLAALWAFTWSRPTLYRLSTWNARTVLGILASDGRVRTRLPGMRRWTGARDLVLRGPR